MRMGSWVAVAKGWGRSAEGGAAGGAICTCMRKPDGLATVWGLLCRS